MNMDRVGKSTAWQSKATRERRPEPEQELEFDGLITWADFVGWGFLVNHDCEGSRTVQYEM